MFPGAQRRPGPPLPAPSVARSARHCTALPSPGLLSPVRCCPALPCPAPFPLSHPGPGPAAAQGPAPPLFPLRRRLSRSHRSAALPPGAGPSPLPRTEAAAATPRSQPFPEAAAGARRCRARCPRRYLCLGRSAAAVAEPPPPGTELRFRRRSCPRRIGPGQPHPPQRSPTPLAATALAGGRLGNVVRASAPPEKDLARRGRGGALPARAIGRKPWGFLGNAAGAGPAASRAPLAAAACAAAGTAPRPPLLLPDNPRPASLLFAPAACTPSRCRRQGCPAAPALPAPPSPSCFPFLPLLTSGRHRPEAALCTGYYVLPAPRYNGYVHGNNSANTSQ